MNELNQMVRIQVEGPLCLFGEVRSRLNTLASMSPRGARALRVERDTVSAFSELLKLAEMLVAHCPHERREELAVLQHYIEGELDRRVASSGRVLSGSYTSEAAERLRLTTSIVAHHPARFARGLQLSLPLSRRRRQDLDLLLRVFFEETSEPLRLHHIVLSFDGEETRDRTTSPPPRLMRAVARDTHTLTLAHVCVEENILEWPRSTAEFKHVEELRLRHARPLGEEARGGFHSMFGDCDYRIYRGHAAWFDDFPSLSRLVLDSPALLGCERSMHLLAKRANWRRLEQLTILSARAGHLLPAKGFARLLPTPAFKKLCLDRSLPVAWRRGVKCAVPSSIEIELLE